MKVWRDVAEVSADDKPSVATVGNFDGVHRGHRHVVAQARELADRLGGLPVVAVTFDPHPMTVIRPDLAPLALATLDQRVSLLGLAGADAVLVVTFDEALAQTSPEDFVRDILLDGVGAAGVVVGENFRFGHRAAGDVDLLRLLAAERGAEVVGLPLDGAHGETWSSSYIRSALAEGDVEAAAEALGRPYSVSGVVQRGEQRGRELGFPTANVPVSATSTAVPADGVYAGRLRRLDRDVDVWLPAAISVGTNPTFDGTQRTVESYVLDRDDLELYDVAVEVAFAERLRGMERFDSIDALITQMRDDVDRARALLVGPSWGSTS
ncbi:MAG TPA: bifunctional riboflavin kinase/FAD synthetase [Nocardioidaceae bacterium]|nr:bifunctional riboflavin kinase/FAD synthetase [Nocardioidaceae bacterium]